MAKHTFTVKGGYKDKIWTDKASDNNVTIDKITIRPSVTLDVSHAAVNCNDIAVDLIDVNISLHDVTLTEVRASVKGNMTIGTDQEETIDFTVGPFKKTVPLGDISSHIPVIGAKLTNGVTLELQSFGISLPAPSGLVITAFEALIKTFFLETDDIRYQLSTLIFKKKLWLPRDKLYLGARVWAVPTMDVASMNVNLTSAAQLRNGALKMGSARQPFQFTSAKPVEAQISPIKNPIVVTRKWEVKHHNSEIDMTMTIDLSMSVSVGTIDMQVGKVTGSTPEINLTGLTATLNGPGDTRKKGTHDIEVSAATLVNGINIYGK